MGKSPGKWIKALLFGKRISKSTASRKTATAKRAHTGAKALAKDTPTNLPLDSDVTLDVIDDAVDASGLQTGAAASVVTVPVQNVGSDFNMVPIEYGSPIHDEATQKEKSVTKIQAAYRGYLARRAFRALKGIIRLQAVIRGHLVRRQAVTTLHSMYGIIKLQAWVRGRLVRQYSVLEMQARSIHQNSLFILNQDKDLHPDEITRILISEMVSSNAFYSKLLASSPVSLPLHLQYDSLEPNSSWSWLIRWSSSYFWAPIPQQERFANSKSKKIHTTRPTEQTSRQKPIVERAFIPNPDNTSLPTVEAEKRKKPQKRSSSSLLEATEEDTQNEIEKVKRNLRKISISKPSNDAPRSEAEKLGEMEKVPNSSVERDRGERVDITPTASKEQEMEIPPVLTEENQVTDVGDHDLADHSEKENQKTRRRRSLPIKQASPVSASQVSPMLPSYMASTESAKAKVRGQGSPRLSQDGGDNGSARRHSLPASNGKSNSPLPRMQKLAHGVGKSTHHTHTHMMCNATIPLILTLGADKVIQTEWKR